ncbi:hypothetical protein Q1695_001171 [Nippostrongylus brasiliensis]|nr:hypothetical protein Q1695_001171 [Nippostrongylus brasiliensis]
MRSVLVLFLLTVTPLAIALDCRKFSFAPACRGIMLKRADVGESSQELDNILVLGWESRRTAGTAMNRESSRSHAVLIIDVMKTEETDDSIVMKKSETPKLVDIAGRQTQVRVEGNQFTELRNVNFISLSVLHRVIRILSRADRGDMRVPYPEFKLTHILRDSLGENSRTAVIVNIHPDIW